MRTLYRRHHTQQRAQLIKCSTFVHQQDATPHAAWFGLQPTFNRNQHAGCVKRRVNSWFGYGKAAREHLGHAVRLTQERKHPFEAIRGCFIHPRLEVKVLRSRACNTQHRTRHHTPSITFVCTDRALATGPQTSTYRDHASDVSVCGHHKVYRTKVGVRCTLQVQRIRHCDNITIRRVCVCVLVQCCSTHQ